MLPYEDDEKIGYGAAVDEAIVCRRLMSYLSSFVLRIIPESGDVIDWSVNSSITFRDVLVRNYAQHCSLSPSHSVCNEQLYTEGFKQNFGRLPELRQFKRVV